MWVQFTPFDCPRQFLFSRLSTDFLIFLRERKDTVKDAIKYAETPPGFVRTKTVTLHKGFYGNVGCELLRNAGFDSCRNDECEFSANSLHIPSKPLCKPGKYKQLPEIPENLLKIYCKSPAKCRKIPE